MRATRCVLLLLSVLAIANTRELLAPGKCQKPKALCGGYCVNLNSDLANCGACGNACRPGESCAGNLKRCKCGPLGNSCGADQVCCDDTCRTAQDLLTDVDNCGACGNACPDGNVCDGGVCKCTSSSQCPDETPICGADGACTKCTYAADKGMPCAIRAAELGVTEFQCDYPRLGGSGRCVECNIANTANNNDCAFLISHPYPGAEKVPTIDPSFTYCGADNVCTTPPVAA